MKHIACVSRRVPAPAFYYQVSLAEKISELATLASFVDSALGSVKGLFDTDA